MVKSDHHQLEMGLLFPSFPLFDSFQSKDANHGYGSEL